MKSVWLILSVFIFLFVSQPVTAHQQKTFLRTRAVGSEDLVLRLQTWSQPWLQSDDGHEEQRRRGLTATGFFSQSTNSQSIGRYFGVGNGTNTLSVGTRTADLFPRPAMGDADVNGYRLVRQDLDSTVRQEQVFNAAGVRIANPAYDPAASPLTGTLTLRPQQTSYGVRLDYRQHFSGRAHRFFVTATLPIVHVENKLRPIFTDQNSIDLSNNQRWTLQDFFAGNLDNSQVKNAVPYEGLDMRKAVADRDATVAILRRFPGPGGINTELQDHLGNGVFIGPFDVFTREGTFDAVTALWANTDQNFRAASSGRNPPIVRADGASPSGVDGGAFTAEVNLAESNLDDFFRTLGAQMDQTIPGGAAGAIPPVDAIQVVPLTADGTSPTTRQYLEMTFPSAGSGVGLPDLLPAAAWVDERNRVNAMSGAINTLISIDPVNVQTPQIGNANALRDLLAVNAQSANDIIITPRVAQVDAAVAATNTISGFLANRDRLEPLTAAKITSGRRKKTGVADLDLAMGYCVIDESYKYLSLSLGLTIPTGGKPKGMYLFEPIVGNGGHIALTANLDAYRAIRCWHNKKFLIKASVLYKYLFSAEEPRTLGLVINNNRVPFGHYFGIGTVDQVGSLVPAANLLTAPLCIRPGNQLDGLLGLSLAGTSVSFDCGYNIHWKDQEKVTLSPLLRQQINTLRLPNLSPDAPTTGVVDFNTTKILSANISQAVDVAVNAPQAPTLFLHRFYVNVGHQCLQRKAYSIYVNLGASYEFPGSNTTLAAYQVWGGLHVGF